jgi:hypothetical protein
MPRSFACRPDISRGTGVDHEIRYRLGLPRSFYIVGLTMGRQLRSSRESEKKPTKHVQEPRIEGASNCDVLGVILQEKVYIALGSSRQHEGSHILSNLRRSAAALFSKCHWQTSMYQTYVTFRDDNEKSEPSSSQLPEMG